MHLLCVASAASCKTNQRTAIPTRNIIQSSEKPKPGPDEKGKKLNLQIDFLAGVMLQIDSKRAIKKEGRPYFPDYGAGVFASRLQLLSLPEFGQTCVIRGGGGIVEEKVLLLVSLNEQAEF